MTARTNTITITNPIPRRSLLSIDDTDTVLVVRCAGTGPYTLTVRQVTRWDRLWWRLRARVRRVTGWLTKPLRGWWWSRCEKPWCWREEIDGYCLRHVGLLDADDDVS